MHSNRPRFTVRIIQQAVGFIIIDEAFGFGIPSQLATELHRDVCHHTDGIRAVPHLDRCYRVLPASHTFQEVPHVIGALVKFDFIILDFLAQDLPVGCIDRAPLDEYPALISLEPDACRISCFLDQADTTGVFCFRAIGSVDIKKSSVRKRGSGLDHDGACILCAVAPLCDVVHMGAPSCDHAEAVLLDLEPSRPAVVSLRVHAVLGEWGLRRGAKPMVPPFTSNLL